MYSGQEKCSSSNMLTLKPLTFDYLLTLSQVGETVNWIRDRISIFCTKLCNVR